MPPPPPPPPPPQKQAQKTLTILLTGFGPFVRISDNPSWSIVETLLSSGPLTIRTPSTLYTIHLLPHPSAIKVSYATIDALVPSLWETGTRAWDYVLHIGVGREGGFKLERRAWVDGYVLRDVDGRFPGDGGVGDGVGKGEGKGKGKGEGEGKGEEKGVEMKGVHGGEQALPLDERPGRQLYTALDVEAIAKFVGESVTAKEDATLVDIVASGDPGMFLCGYTFRASLLEAEKRGEEERARVLFLHVPPKGKRYGVDTGVDVVLKVVEGMDRTG
ncbi:hypothetical protein BZA05DRAFT_457548 [Tricharina praecox]|uniref:uncharacterized protein n=1 Tax=Tricharina praecox TaxID=43433 RepID=UPI00221E7A7C|nr:uncharacterized protein BZA05DRAFT_457548 [Tricharina praecox]KAI5847490.1 hypothetical protein BZA05DRAFT_457548 [Tricharina praecox]